MKYSPATTFSVSMFYMCNHWPPHSIFLSNLIQNYIDATILCFWRGQYIVQSIVTTILHAIARMKGLRLGTVGLPSDRSIVDWPPRRLCHAGIGQLLNGRNSDNEPNDGIASLESLSIRDIGIVLVAWCGDLALVACLCFAFCLWCGSEGGLFGMHFV